MESVKEWQKHARETHEEALKTARRIGANDAWREWAER